MPIHTAKNIYDAAEPDVDGLRILATRFWPRGVKRGAADLYLPDLAPSKELVQAFKSEAIGWSEFRRRYTSEMKGQTSLLRMLNWLDARGEDVTLLCACDRADRCHRTVLAALIQRQ